MADVHNAGMRGSTEFASAATGDGLAGDAIQMSAYAKNHCKTCQLPLVEGGRAYELGGYRWHVECFRCSICSSQMDADTNMLVLGNGTLVCHNCSYFCAICQKKIEDLAILTNDQAFCADCFVCRNCQRRIDDLKYARTSQGIFCMSCHNALMARKQRKAAAAAAAGGSTQGTPTGGSPAPRASSISSSRSSIKNRLSSVSARDKELPGLPPSRPPAVRSQSDSLSFKLSEDELPADVPAPIPEQPLAQAPETPQPLRTAYHSRNRSVGAGEFSIPKELAPPDVPPEILAHSPPHGPQGSRESKTGVSDSFIADLDGVGNHSLGIDIPQLPSTVLGVPIQLESPPSRSPEQRPSVPAPMSPSAPPPPHPRGIARPPQPLASPADSVGSVYSPTRPVRSPVRSVHSSQSPTAAAPPGARSPNRSPTRSPTRAAIDEVPLLATPGSAASHVQALSQNQNTPPVTAAAPSPQAYAAIQERTPHSSHGEYVTPREELAVPYRSLRRANSPARLNTKASSDLVDPASAGDEEIDASALMQALIRSRERISELELLLEREIHSNKVAAEATTEDPAELTRSILERRATLAGLEAKQKVAHEELRATRDGADAEQFAAALNRHKDEMQGEIEELTAQRDALRAQVAELTAKRDQALEESSILNVKNSQLVDMNNELLKQTIEKFGPNTLWSSGLAPSTSGGEAGSASSSQTASNGISGSLSPIVSRERRSRVKRKDVGGQGARAPSDSDYGLPYHATGSQERVPGEYLTPRSPQSARYPGSDTMVTVLDAPTQKQRKNLWPFRRPGKGGLTRVFAQEVTVGADGEAVSAAGPAGQTSQLGQLPASTSTSGLSAMTAPGGQPMLGELLEARCAMDQAPVPNIVTRCLAEVEKRGLDMEGIYRKSGSKLQIDQILQYFESDSEHLQSDLEKDISAVTSAVKQYLRYLADPIIPYAHYNAYVQAGRKQDLSELYMVVKALPPAHYATLETLIRHLAVVAANGSKNLMNSRNLAVVFAPTLARDQTGEREVLDMQARNDATQLLIDNHDMFE